MPRELGDVLHYFMPELAPEPLPASPRSSGQRIAIPIGELDVVRAALVWNLAVELARRGSRAAVVAPAHGQSAASLWPEPGRGPLGIGLHPVETRDPIELARAVDELEQQAAQARGPCFVLIALPPDWLGRLERAESLLEWLLVLARPEEREVLEAYAMLKRASRLQPTVRLGVSVYGVQSIAQAERTFGLLAGAAERHLGQRLVSYGLLVDDLHLCRSIVTQRPVGVSHPRCPAARALADVARLLLGDAGEACDG